MVSKYMDDRTLLRIDTLLKHIGPVLVNAFLKELDENGIVYDLQDVNELEFPNVVLPWTV